MAIAGVVAVLAGLCGCGQKGPLYLPDPAAASKPGHPTGQPARGLRASIRSAARQSTRKGMSM